MFNVKPKEKVFCIGFNKTGTTTLENTLREFGYKLGNQEKAELLIDHYERGDWSPIIKYCKTAEAFQDIPFSLPYTWLIIHEHFPNAKFILTTRDANEWYKSLVNHHSLSFGNGIDAPSSQQLRDAIYRKKYKGFIYRSMKAIWKNNDEDLYNKEFLISTFHRHNQDIQHFFKDKPNFVEISVNRKDGFKKLVEFLDVKTDLIDFPHLNKRR